MRHNFHSFPAFLPISFNSVFEREPCARLTVLVVGITSVTKVSALFIRLLLKLPTALAPRTLLVLTRSGEKLLEGY